MAQTYNIEIELQAKFDEAKRVVDELNNIATKPKRYPSVRAAGDGGAESGVGDSLAGRVCGGGVVDYAKPRLGNPAHNDIRRQAGS